MGFSVTAANIVFFVAILSAASVGMGAYWKTQTYLERAKDAETQHVYDMIHTNITLGTVTCTPTNCKGGGGNNTVTMTIYNGGDTVVDMKNMSYLIQGVWTNKVLTPTISGPAGTVSSTWLLMPGETASVTFYQVSFNSGGNIWVKATTEDGVSVTGKK